MSSLGATTYTLGCTGRRIGPGLHLVWTGVLFVVECLSLVC